MRRHVAVPVSMFVLAVLAVSAPADAQLEDDAPPAISYRWAGWQAYWENDALVLGDGTDRHYINGIRLTHTQHSNSTSHVARRLFDGCWRLLCWGKSPSDTTSIVGTVAIGQNISTPDQITAFEPDPTDRPFAGYLYASYRTTFGSTRVGGSRDAPRTYIRENSVELSVGVLGPMSLAGGAHAGIHVLRASGMPKGWRTEIPNEPTLQLMNLLRLGIRQQFSNSQYAPQIELAPHVVWALGNVHTFAGGGGTVRFGWNLTGLANDVMTYSLVPGDAERSWGVAAVYTWEKRHFWRNAFLDGGLRGGTPSVQRESGVRDHRFGVELRADPLTVSYRTILRTQDLAPRPGLGAFPDHRYGSLSLLYTRGTESGLGDAITWLLERSLVEAGFGTGITKTPGDTERGRAVRIAIGPSLGDVGFSLDLNGVVREQRVRNEDDTYTDYFFNTFGVSTWLAPLGRVGPGTPLLRVGLGSARHKKQNLDGALRHEESKRRLDVFLGAGYEVPLPVSAEVALGLDLTWSRVPLSGIAAGSSGSFLASVIGIKWRPYFHSSPIHDGS